jgi:hypothetical protein
MVRPSLVIGSGPLLIGSAVALDQAEFGLVLLLVVPACFPLSLVWITAIFERPDGLVHASLSSTEL